MNDDLPCILEVDEDLLLKFIGDMAQGIHNYDTIAERYGLGSKTALFEYLNRHPIVVQQIKRHKAAHMSDASVERRIRLKSGLACEELIVPIARLVASPSTPMSQRIDGLKQLARMAGTDGPPPLVREGGGDNTGITFQLNFLWSDGTRQQLAGSTNNEPAITGPVIEHLTDE